MRHAADERSALTHLVLNEAPALSTDLDRCANDGNIFRDSER